MQKNKTCKISLNIFNKIEETKFLFFWIKSGLNCLSLFYCCCWKEFRLNFKRTTTQKLIKHKLNYFFKKDKTNQFVS